MSPRRVAQSAGLGVVAAVVLSFAVYFGPQIRTYMRHRPMLMAAQAHPRGWDNVPRPLTESTSSTAPGTAVSYYGCTFEVPWTGIVRERKHGRWSEVTFKTGQSVRVVDPQYTQEDPITPFAGLDRAVYDRGFPQGVHDSKYEQYKAVLSITPSRWSPLTSHRAFARTETLLAIKGIWFEHNPHTPNIFSFSTQKFRGFEIGVLGADWQQVKLTLFDAADHMFLVAVSGGRYSGGEVTQADLNRTIQSFAVGQQSSK